MDRGPLDIDDDCYIKLIRIINSTPLRECPPCLQAGCKLVSGHVGGISCVRFTANDAHVVSIGKGDRSIFIWKVEDVLDHTS